MKPKILHLVFKSNKTFENTMIHSYFYDSFLIRNLISSELSSAEIISFNKVVRLFISSFITTECFFSLDLEIWMIERTRIIMKKMKN